MHRIDLPLRVLGVWHLACAVARFASVLPVLPMSIRHPVGLMTLAMVVVTALVGIALFVGNRSVLVAAAIIQAAQVLALAIPGIVVWIVRVGLRVSISMPSPTGPAKVAVRHDATLFTLWGAAARLPIGVSVNLCALVAFAVCMTCLQHRAGDAHAE